MEQAKSIMINLLEGVAYLHERGIMHRDLKLENIMVKRDDIRSGRVIPVIVDLGLAEYLSSTKYLYTRCGTPGYVAPEVLKIKSTDPVQTYTCACDVFSLGVIFHILYFNCYLDCSKNQFLKAKKWDKLSRKTVSVRLTPTAKILNLWMNKEEIYCWECSAKIPKIELLLHRLWNILFLSSKKNS